MHRTGGTIKPTAKVDSRVIAMLSLPEDRISEKARPSLPNIKVVPLDHLADGRGRSLARCVSAFSSHGIALLAAMLHPLNLERGGGMRPLIAFSGDDARPRLYLTGYSSRLNPPPFPPPPFIDRDRRRSQGSRGRAFPSNPRSYPPLPALSRNDLTGNDFNRREVSQNGSSAEDPSAGICLLSIRPSIRDNSALNLQTRYSGSLRGPLGVSTPSQGEKFRRFPSLLSRECRRPGDAQYACPGWERQRAAAPTLKLTRARHDPACDYKCPSAVWQEHFADQDACSDFFFAFFPVCCLVAHLLFAFGKLLPGDFPQAISHDATNAQ